MALLKGSLNKVPKTAWLFLEHPVNHPVKSISKFFREPVRQDHKDLLQAFIVQELIKDGIAGGRLPLEFLREQGSDEQRTGMMLEIGEIFVYLFLQQPGLFPERPDLRVQGDKASGGIGWS